MSSRDGVTGREDSAPAGNFFALCPSDGVVTGAVVTRLRNVHIVPLGGVDPETVAELAHGLKRRRLTSSVNILAPRRMDEGGDPVAALAHEGASDDVTLGVT